MRCSRKWILVVILSLVAPAIAVIGRPACSVSENAGLDVPIGPRLDERGATSHPTSSWIPSASERALLKGHFHLRMRASSHERVEARVQVDNNRRIEALVWRSGTDVLIEWRRSDLGEVKAQRGGEEHIGEDVHFESFVLADVPAGELVIVLQAGSSPVEAEIELIFSSDVVLISVVRPDLMEPQGPVSTLYCAFIDSHGLIRSDCSVALAATLTAPGGSEVPLVMWDDGAHDDCGAKDGIFAASIGGPNALQSGRYAIHCTGRACRGTEMFERTSTTHFVVQEDQRPRLLAASESPVDSDEDGLYESLTFDFVIQGLPAGHYRLVGSLRDSDLNYFAQAMTVFAVEKSGAMVHAVLSVGGEMIVAHGIGGPWVLTDVLLCRDEQGSAVVAFGQDITTRAYGSGEFEE